jgi:hypothetical protein
VDDELEGREYLRSALLDRWAEFTEGERLLSERKKHVPRLLVDDKDWNLIHTKLGSLSREMLLIEDRRKRR